MKAMQTRLSRRHLLKGGAALGFSAMTPLLLSACGGGGSDGAPGGDDQGGGLGATQGGAKREKQTLQFDLSHAPIANPRLRLMTSKSHGAALVAHTKESRASHRLTDAVLRAVPDANLTHYLEDVDLPANALQMGSVWGTHPTTGKAVLAIQFLHLPTSSLEALEQRRVNRGQAKRGLSAKLRAYGVTEAALSDAPVTSQLGPYSAPFDVATTLLFQHPGVMNLSPDLGTDIVDRIQNLPCDPNDQTCNPFAGTVAQQVSNLIVAGGYPSTSSSGSWATLVPVVDTDTKQPYLDDSGNPLYQYSINPALDDLTAAALKQVMNSINDDPMFMGTNWQNPSVAASAVTADSAVGRAMASTRLKTKKTALATAATSYSVVCSEGFGTRKSGVRLLDVDTDDSRNVVVTVVNEFIKSNSVYVKYLDANGKELVNTNPTVYDAGNAYYNCQVGPQVQIMGVPLQGDLAITSNIRFLMPDGAVTAEMSYGSLGLGGSDAFSKRALIGSMLTMSINLVIPTMLLAIGAYVSTSDKTLQTILQQSLTDPVVFSKLMAFIAVALGGSEFAEGVQSSASNLTFKPFLIGLGTTIIQVLMQCAPRFASLFAAWLVAQGVKASLADAIPIVGQVIWGVSVAADIATIGETLIECVCCPAIQTFQIALDMPSSVVISHDPNDYEFPATATQALVTATYDGGMVVKAKAAITPGRTADLVVPLQTFKSDGVTPQGVKSGGHVQVQVVLVNDQNAIVGTAVSDSIVNMPGTATNIAVTITELLPKINGPYVHQEKLVLNNGVHSWDTSAAQPTTTHANLCQGATGAICSLQGLTVHTPSGSAGYGYEGGASVNLCGNPSDVGSMNVIRGMFLGDNPDSGARFSGCGEADPIGIVYSPTGTKNFMLQMGSDGVHHLRGIDLTAQGFAMGQALTWGHFSSAHDSMCVVAGGYVAGINRSTHRFEILTLPMVAAQDDDNTAAQDFGALKGGYGSRAGLLDTPVAIGAKDDLLFVLEQGNRRVQVFDVDGNNPTVSPFLDGSGNATPLLDLTAQDPSGTVSYLDIAVESTGFVYVLSYLNDGNAASDYRLDVYSPTGAFVYRNANVAAGNIAVDLFRNIYTLNYEELGTRPNVEPSLSRWIPQ